MEFFERLIENESGRRSWQFRGNAQLIASFRLQRLYFLVESFSQLNHRMCVGVCICVYFAWLSNYLLKSVIKRGVIKIYPRLRRVTF